MQDTISSLPQAQPVSYRKILPLERLILKYILNFLVLQFTSKHYFHKAVKFNLTHRKVLVGMGCRNPQPSVKNINEILHRVRVKIVGFSGGMQKFEKKKRGIPSRGEGRVMVKLTSKKSISSIEDVGIIFIFWKSPIISVSRNEI